jgi:hypothetical protein
MALQASEMRLLDSPPHVNLNISYMRWDCWTLHHMWTWTFHIWDEIAVFSVTHKPKLIAGLSATPQRWEIACLASTCEPEQFRDGIAGLSIRRESEHNRDEIAELYRYNTCEPEQFREKIAGLYIPREPEQFSMRLLDSLQHVNRNSLEIRLINLTRTWTWTL